MSGSTAIAWNRDALPPGPEQDAVVKGITGEIGDKGFIVANIDKVVNWARTEAERGLPSMIARSPTIEPGPTMARIRSAPAAETMLILSRPSSTR